MKRVNIHRHRNDWLVVFGIVAALGAIYGFVVYSQVSRLNEQTLIFELRSLRTAVATFNLMKGRNPRDLKELASSSFVTDRGTDRPYVSEKLVKRGFKDPFGRPYLYSAKGGWVRSSSEKYYDW